MSGRFISCILKTGILLCEWTGLGDNSAVLLEFSNKIRAN